MGKKDHQLYRRPYMTGKARGKEEEDGHSIHNATWHASAQIRLQSVQSNVISVRRSCLVLNVLANIPI